MWSLFVSDSDHKVQLGARNARGTERQKARVFGERTQMAIGILSSSVLTAEAAGRVSGVVSMILATMYLISAIRLTAMDRSRKPART